MSVRHSSLQVALEAFRKLTSGEFGKEEMIRYRILKDKFRIGKQKKGDLTSRPNIIYSMDAGLYHSAVADDNLAGYV